MAELEFFGVKYGMNPPHLYEWEMMEFASAADNGADGNVLSGVAAVHTLLKAVIVAEDWAKFRAAARKNHARVEQDLMPLVVAAFTQETARPTLLPADSSAGPEVVQEKSGDVSYLRVVRRLEEEGRPDQAYLVKMAAEHAASSVG